MTKKQRSSKKHHYVPRSYLAGFTIGCTIFSPFFAIKKDATYRETTPGSVAYKNNLYCINMPDIPPDYVEKWIGVNIEGPAKLVLVKIGEASKLPPLGTPDYEELMLFIGFLFTRHPRIKDAMERAEKRLVDQLIDMTLSSKEHYESILATMNWGGKDVSRFNNNSYEELKASQERGGYIFSMKADYKNCITVLDSAKEGAEDFDLNPRLPLL